MIQLRTFSAVVVVQKEDDGLPLLSGGGRNSATLFYYYSLPEWGILVLYTLGETETEAGRDRERDGGERGRYNTLYQTQIYSNLQMAKESKNTKD